MPEGRRVTVASHKGTDEDHTADIYNNQHKENSYNPPSVPNELFSWEFNHFPITRECLTKRAGEYQVKEQGQGKIYCSQTAQRGTSRVLNNETRRQYEHEGSESLVTGERATSKLSPLEHQNASPAHDRTNETACGKQNFLSHRLHCATIQAVKRLLCATASYSYGRDGGLLARARPLEQIDPTETTTLANTGPVPPKVAVLFIGSSLV